MLKPVPCPSPRPWMTCFESDGRPVTVMKEWDENLRRWHISVGGYPRRCSTQECLEALEAVMPGAAKAWVEQSAVVNPYVRHFFESVA